MGLQVTNTTGAPITLVRPVLPVVVVAANSANNVTSELRGLAPADYTALEAQRAALAGGLVYNWTSGAQEYPVGTLAITAAATGPATATNIVGGAHNHGGTTSADGAGIGGATPAITCDPMQMQQGFAAPPAKGALYIAAYPAGAPIDDAVGPWAQFQPSRTMSVLGSATAAPGSFQINYVDENGVAQDTGVLVHPGGAVRVQVGRACHHITRFRATDPGGADTWALETGDGFGLGQGVTSIDRVGVNGAMETPTVADAASGTVVPATVPNAARHYSVLYTVTPTASQASHNHGGLTVAHSHVISGAADHNHTQNAHSH